MSHKGKVVGKRKTEKQHLQYFLVQDQTERRIFSGPGPDREEKASSSRHLAP